jgi:hypothetical protein
LSQDERDWIDRYHLATLDLMMAELDEHTLAWLQQACAPL